ncbi:MAG: hypothetical protein GC204_03735 [Chloroflexi bacterium]|nr:hypothetical protein [Chloroflexota bacterium]
MVKQAPSRTRKQSEGSAPGDGRVIATAELIGLLELALQGAKGDGVPTYVLSALHLSLKEVIGRAPDKSMKTNPPPPWQPNAKQIWSPMTKGVDGKRISAWQAFQTGFGGLSYNERPYAFQVRAHPKSRALYNALCMFVSRNKAKGLSPSSIGDLFPIAEEARGGALSSAGNTRRREP